MKNILFNITLFILCLSASASAQGDINLNATPVTCVGNNGTINAKLVAGNTPVTFAWSNGVINTVNGFTDTIDNLPAGEYSVIIFDAHNCVVKSSITVEENCDPTACTLSISTSITAESCTGNDGSINLEVSGGTPPYTYLWSNNSTSKNISGLSEGYYSVTVTDANSCVEVASANIEKNCECTLTVSATTSNENCDDSDGSVNLTVSGGTSPYTYEWNNGSTSQNLSNIYAGEYTATVTDAEGCIAETTAVVESICDTLCMMEVLIATYCVKGQGLAPYVLGGEPPYTYEWSNGSTSWDLYGLPDGSYTVTVTDANDCIAEATTTIEEDCEPCPIEVSIIDITGESCGGNDGSVNIFITGGTSYVLYYFSDGSMADLYGLSAGDYDVTVYDAAGCTEEISFTIENDCVPSPTCELTVSTSATDESCTGNDGKIELTLSGGTSPYSYQWDNNSTSQNLNNLSPGSYSVMVTDANGCEAETSVTVENNCDQPPSSCPLNISVSTTEETCSNGDGSASLTVSGGNPPYSYLWSNGNTTSNLTNVYAGYYLVFVTDANGCITQKLVGITNDCDSPPTSSCSIDISVSSAQESCDGNDGSISLTVSDGTSPYTYEWNIGSTSKNLNNLSADEYSVTVTDANNCVADTSVSVEQVCAGCTNINADNYNQNATTDDGSCEYGGCTDTDANNYDSNATYNDNSCEYDNDKNGCTDPSADNYDCSATNDDGSCAYGGCTDTDAYNYNPNATYDDGSCYHGYIILATTIMALIVTLVITIMVMNIVMITMVALIFSPKTTARMLHMMTELAITSMAVPIRKLIIMIAMLLTMMTVVNIVVAQIKMPIIITLTQL